MPVIPIIIAVAASSTAATVATGVAVAGTAFFGSAAVAAAKEIYDEGNISKGRREGESTTAAKYSMELEKITNALEEASKKLNNLEDTEEFFKLIIALTAVGLATASADGLITSDELMNLDEFVTGIAHSNLPPHVRDTITKLKENPPNFRTALQYVYQLKNVDKELFEAVIVVIARSDDNFSKEEVALLEAFRRGGLNF